MGLSIEKLQRAFTSRAGMKWISCPVSYRQSPSSITLDFESSSVTNQRCVAKDLITFADLDSMHQRMCETLAASGAKIDTVYYCPHDEEPFCGCRKPAPGMLLNAAHRHKIDLTASWMIGDSEADVQAGRNAGCKTALIANVETWNGGADLIAPSSLDAVHQIVKSRCTLSSGVPDDQDVIVQPDNVSA